ncbi:MAG: cupin domain-containing protein [Dehalococcoidia bacterium]|nr:cupin domain-containing protein [Dehalococcoidia bacterium]
MGCVDLGGDRHTAPGVARIHPEPDVTAPDGSQIRLLTHAGRASLCEVTLEAGRVSRPVWHRKVEETWYVLQGTGSVWRCPPDIGPEQGTVANVSPGAALVIPPRWRFQFGASDAGALRFLCFTTPPWPGEDEAQPAGEGGLGPPTV